MVDPELRLRTVRTAASTIAEVHRTESLREYWRKRRNKSAIRKGTSGRGFFRRGKEAATSEADPRDQPMARESAPTAKQTVVGRRREIHINIPLPAPQLDARGEPITK